MEETKNKKQKMSAKQVAVVSLALVLVAVVSIVGTLAFLGVLSNDEENVFVGSDGISLELTEPNFDDEEDDDSQNYTPGMTIPKDPLLTNTSSGDGDLSEWVAMRVDYLINSTSTDYAAFVGTTNNAVISSINGLDSTKWKKVTPGNGTYDIYIYKSRLDVNASTDALFSSVTINNNLVNLPTFTIKVQGAAIKNDSSVYSNGSSMDVLEDDKVSYGASNTTNEYKIMDELVKLLTNDDEYTALMTATTDVSVDDEGDNDVSNDEGEDEPDDNSEDENNS